MKINRFAAASAGMALSFALAGAAEAATIRVVALSGQEAPGTGGAVFSRFGAGIGIPALKNAGEVAFIAELFGTGVTLTNNRGVFTSKALVAREGDAAPEAGGAVFAGFGFGAELNDSGEVAFQGSLGGAGISAANSRGIFTSDALAARTGSEAPGTGGPTFAFVGETRLNNAGETAFSGRLIGTGITNANNNGIFTSAAPVVREGDAVPSIGGAVFSDFGIPALNDAGATAFRGSFSGAGLTTANNNGIFASGGLVARAGDAAPGSGGAVFDAFNDPSLNESGETAFLGFLRGEGVTVANSSGIFTSGALVTRSADAAPGTGGAVFSGFGSPALNDAGETAFTASLSGTGVTSTNDSGIFATEGGVLDRILREGDLLDIGGGDLRTITSLSLGQSCFNNNGDIAFLATFAAGAGGAAGQGIFVYEAGSVSAAVPLPPALGLMLFGVAALGFVGRRRARG